MTTYGPSRLTLAERLAATDAVVLVKGAVLVHAAPDSQSENQREIGEFDLAVAEVLDGDAPDSVRIRAARDADGPWPIPGKGRFIAFIQRDGTERWVLVHNSAFRIRGNVFEFDEAIGCQRDVEPREKVPILDVRRLLDARREGAARYAKALRANEGDVMEASQSARPSEMPESSELASWLDSDHGQSGRHGNVGRLEAEATSTKRRTRKGRTGR